MPNTSKFVLLFFIVPAMCATLLAVDGWRQSSVTVLADPRKPECAVTFEYQVGIETSPVFQRLPDGVTLAVEDQKQEGLKVYKFKVPTGNRSGNRTVYFDYQTESGGRGEIQAIITVPDVTEVTPRLLAWRINEPKTSKTAFIAYTSQQGYGLTSAIPSTKDITASIQGVATQLYEVTVTPLEGIKRGRYFVRIQGADPEGIKTSFNIYIEIR